MLHHWNDSPPSVSSFGSAAGKNLFLNSQVNSVETRQLARLMGSLSFEERLLIMNALVSIGEAGLSQMELADLTNLSQSSVGINLDYMTSTDIVKYRSEAAGKVFVANYDLLENLFSFMNKNYGAGLVQATRARSVNGSEEASR